MTHIIITAFSCFAIGFMVGKIRGWNECIDNKNKTKSKS